MNVLFVAMGFIGIANNIWRDTLGTGGGPFGPPPARGNLLLVNGVDFVLLTDGTSEITLAST